MLNKAERFKILEQIQYYCTVGFFPVTVDPSSWQLLQDPTTGRKRWLCLAYFGSFVLHSLYKIATFTVACFVQKDTALHELIIHAVLSLGAMAIIFWYYQLFIKNPRAFRAFFWMTLTGNIGGRRVIESQEKGNSISRFKSYTVQDLVAINLPYMIAVVIVAIIGTFMYCPTLQLLLYAGLPEQLQTWPTFLVLLMEEIRYMIIFAAVAITMWTLQVISFDLINNQLSHIIGSMQWTAQSKRVERTYRSLRHIQLYVGLLNVVNRYFIFSWKIVCITLCIITGYSAIAHFSDYPIFGVMYYLILIDGIFIYIVSYDKAFRVPELFEEAAKLNEIRFLRGGDIEMKILKRQMRSIPRVGIKVGEFHVLERESTPVFVNYVLINIVSMLVAYRH